MDKKVVGDGGGGTDAGAEVAGIAVEGAEVSAGVVGGEVEGLDEVLIEGLVVVLELGADQVPGRGLRDVVEGATLIPEQLERGSGRRDLGDVEGLCAPSGSTTRMASPPTSARIPARSPTRARCAPSGSTTRATSPSTRGCLLTPPTMSVLALLLQSSA